MITKKQQAKILLIGFSSLLLGACSGGNDDLKKYIYEIKSRAVKKIEPIPKFAPLPIFKFPDNDSRRNPFKPIDVNAGKDLYAPDQNRVKQPLEAFPLDALKFVGVLKQGNEIWGLIMQPDKKVVRVKLGNYMGQNYGRIILIKDNLIKLEEIIKNAGKWEKNITTINLNTGK
jgi:type IV pilus assembly protein PilP